MAAPLCLLSVFDSLLKVYEQVLDANHVPMPPCLFLTKLHTYLLIYLLTLTSHVNTFILLLSQEDQVRNPAEPAAAAIHNGRSHR